MKDGKFEVGDKVRVVGSTEDIFFRNGDVGTVMDQVDDEVHVNFNTAENGEVFSDGKWTVPLDELELVQPAIQPAAQPAKKSRVRAYKEDYIQRATLAEMRVHQLDVDLNKAVDEAVDLRAANELAAKELVRLTDQLNSQLADFLTQKTLANRYKELYDGLTVWQVIRRAFGKAVHHA